MDFRIALALAPLALLVVACGGDAESPPTPPEPVPSTSTETADVAPIPTVEEPASGNTQPRQLRDRWSNDAETRARRVLASVRGDAHQKSTTARWPASPTRALPERARIVLVGGAAGYADDTVTVVEIDGNEVWAARGKLFQERVDQRVGETEWQATNVRVTRDELDALIETAQFLRAVRFERSDGKSNGNRAAGTDENLYYVRLEEGDQVVYERCEGQEALVGGVRGGVSVRHDAVFQVFAELLSDATRKQALDQPRWQAWLARELSTFSRKQLNGDRDGKSRLAQSVARHAGWSGNAAAATELERLDRRHEARMVKVRTEFDADWAETFLMRRYGHSREEQVLARKVREQFHLQAPDRYLKFLGAEIQELQKDEGALGEVVAELQARYGAQARALLLELLAHEELSVRVAAAIAMVSADSADPDGVRTLDEVAGDPSNTEVLWRGFEKSARYRVIQFLTGTAEKPGPWSADRLREQLAVKTEDARFLSMFCDALAARGKPVSDADQTTIYRGVLEAPITCGTLRAVERLIQLDDRPSLKRMKERIADVGRMREPATWTAIDSSNWRNARMPVEKAFWNWVVRPPKK